MSGLVGPAGQLEHRETSLMSVTDLLDDGHHRFGAELALESAGRRGITVRVVPRHDLLVDPLELGCVAWAS